MNYCTLIYDPKTKEFSFRIKDETIIISKSLIDTNGLIINTFGAEKQEELIKLLVKNMTLKRKSSKTFTF